MDPLSDILSLLKPQSYASGGFGVDGDIAIQWPRHRGIKCYAMLCGDCWLRVEGVPDPVPLHAGDCFLLPRGLPFSLSTDPTLTPVDFLTVKDGWKQDTPATLSTSERYLVGGHFLLGGAHAEILLQTLPPIVHIRAEADKAAMRWSLERMQAELREARPGSALITQQLAYMMLVQALRLHLTEGATRSVGWLFALADKQMSVAIGCIHADPGYPWTLGELAKRAGMSRSAFALRFRETVGKTPLGYLTRWRMMLAGDRLQHTDDSIAEIAASLGYDSESAFGKAFRRVMGCSPRQHGRTAAAATRRSLAAPEPEGLVPVG